MPAVAEFGGAAADVGHARAGAGGTASDGRHGKHHSTRRRKGYKAHKGTRRIRR